MKIPKQAKKVFTGEIFEVFQWPQKMFDGSTATFERLKRPNTLQIIPTIGKKIIIASEEQPGHKRSHTLLGGRQEKNENHLAGAKRELKEESGLVSSDWTKYLTFSPVSKIDWDIHYFIARNCERKFEQKLDAGEKIKLIEVSFEDFIEMVLSDEYSVSSSFALHIAKLKLANRLGEFKKLLFQK